MNTPNDEILVLNGVTLTAAYTGNSSSAYEYRSGAGLTFLINYDRHSGSASAYLELQVEYSYDASAWHQWGQWADSGSGVMTFTAYTYKQLGDGKVPLVIDEPRARWFRVKVQETSVTGSNFGTVYVYAYPHTL